MNAPTPKTKKKIDTNALLKSGETLNDAALRLTKEVQNFDVKIDALIQQRSLVKQELRHIHGKLVTLKLNEEAKS